MDTLVIGIDGGEWAVIDPLIEEGRLPHIAELKQNGVSGDLESVTPPVSPPAWNSILTGTNPGKHGIFDFSTFDERYRRRSINATDRQSTPFWTVLNDQGIATGLFKVPFTYPPDSVDGFVVSGFPTPDRVNDYAVPTSIATDLGPPTDLFEDWAFQASGDYEAFRDDLLAVADRQTDVLCSLIDRYDPEFLMTVYDGADRIQHFYWKYLDESHARYDPDPAFTDAIPQYYERVDEAVGRLRERANEDTNVVVLSDHGFGPLEQDVYIDEWLERNGFYAGVDSHSVEGLSSLSREKVATLIQYGWQVIERSGLEEAVENVLPAQLYKSGKGLVSASNGKTAQWDRTAAFFTTLSGQSIYINLENRFVEGSVPEAEYESIIERLRSGLLGLRDPNTGQRVINAVHHRDDLFEGWAVEDGPDLIVEAAPRYTLTDGENDELVRPATQSNQDRSGDHREDGILAAAGPAFGKGAVTGATVFDIAPTLLYLHDAPIPEAMDGKVLRSFLDTRVRDEAIERTERYGRAARETRAWSAEEADELEARLEDMGYL